MSNEDVSKDLLAHSEAKVQLYGEYLLRYLAVLTNKNSPSVKSIKKIFLFDLLCSEGVYENKGVGSPIITLQTLNRINREALKSKSIKIYFNDNGISKIEPNLTKVERLENIIDTKWKKTLPPSININYWQLDYREALKKSVSLLQKELKFKALFFIDPYGYKIVQPNDFRTILNNQNSEIILFLPIVDMYRFASKSIQDKSFKAGESLRDILSTLYSGEEIPYFKSAHHFIDELKSRFYVYLNDLNPYVDSFFIERDENRTFAIFFFTMNELGIEKWIEAKYEIDKERGKGFSSHHKQNNLKLFTESQLQHFPTKLLNYIKENSPTNREVRLFGFREGFKYTDVNEDLKPLVEQGFIQVRSLNETLKPRGSSTYLGDKKRLVKYIYTPKPIQKGLFD